MRIRGLSPLRSLNWQAWRAGCADANRNDAKRVQALLRKEKAPRLPHARGAFGGAAFGARLGGRGLPRSRQSPNSAHRVKFIAPVGVQVPSPPLEIGRGISNWGHPPTAQIRVLLFLTLLPRRLQN